MKRDRVNQLIGELIRISAEYSAEEFEEGAKIVKAAIHATKIEKLALTFVNIKKEIANVEYTSNKDRIISSPDMIIHSPDNKDIFIETKVSNSIDKKFYSLLRNITNDKKRFKHTIQVRLFIKELFGYEIGNIKDGRERIIKYAIREFNKSTKSRQYKIYQRITALSAPISEDFEGYSRIIKRE